jgi:hypothetical protein
MKNWLKYRIIRIIGATIPQPIWLKKNLPFCFDAENIENIKLVIKYKEDISKLWKHWYDIDVRLEQF